MNIFEKWRSIFTGTRAAHKSNPLVKYPNKYDEYSTYEKKTRDGKTITVHKRVVYFTRGGFDWVEVIETTDMEKRIRFMPLFEFEQTKDVDEIETHSIQKD